MSLQEQKDAKLHENASTQIDVPGGVASKIIETGKKLIPDDALAGDGRVQHIHLTLKYGVREDAGQLKAAVAGHAPFTVTLGRVMVFEPSESSGGEAPVVVEAHAPQLVPLKESIGERIGKFKDTFPYSPHVTVAYVKPELAEQYAGSDAFAGIKFQADAVTLSARDDDNRARFPLGSKQAAAPAAAPEIVKRDEPAVEEQPQPEPEQEKPAPRPKPEKLTPQEADKLVGDSAKKTRKKKQPMRPTESPQFKSWFAGSKVVRDGKPLMVYHGTTHDIQEFDPQVGNAEAWYGPGLYFTDSRVDVAENYATSKGADLTHNIEGRADQIMDGLREKYEEEKHQTLDYSSADYKQLWAKAYDEAKTEFVGPNQGVTMPVYLSIKNPVIVADKGGTYFDIQFDEETGEESGTGLAFYNALNLVGGNFAGDTDALWARITENGPEFSAADFEHAAREMDDIQDDEGRLVNGTLVAQVYQELGYDGIIQDAWGTFGGGAYEGKGMKMDPGTRHYIVWSPSQVKSAIGNVGTYDPKSPSITAKYGADKTADAESYFTGMDEAARSILTEFEQHINDPKYRQKWEVVPAARLKKIWNDYAKTGMVRDEKGMGDISWTVQHNIWKIHANTILCGHTEQSPLQFAENVMGENFEEKYGRDPFQDDNSFFDDDKGAWRLSDYALDPLVNAASKLENAKTAEQQLQAVDFILSIVHARSDLASWFVQGGTATLNSLAGYEKSGAVEQGARDRLGVLGQDVVEERTIGDYDLFVTYDRSFGVYQIGMQRVGMDASDIEQQAERQRQPRGRGDRRELVATVRGWVDKYHLLIIGSMNPAKTEKYVRLLRMLGFKPVEKDLMGIPFAMLTDGTVKLGSARLAGRKDAVTSLVLRADVEGFPVVWVRWEGLRWRQVLKAAKAIAGEVAGRRVPWDSIQIFNSPWKSKDEQDAGWESSKPSGQVMFDVLKNGSWVSVGGPYKPEAEAAGATGEFDGNAAYERHALNMWAMKDAGWDIGSQPAWVLGRVADWEKASAADAGSAANMMNELYPMLGEPSLPKPDIKVVNQPRAGWLGRNKWSIFLKNGQISWASNTTIEVQKSILSDENTLRRVVAHELCHHADSLVNGVAELERYKDFGKIGYDTFVRGQSGTGHGTTWKAYAAKYNGKYGADFVNQRSDESYVQEELPIKPYYIRLWNNPNGKMYYSVSTRIGPRIKKYLERKAVNPDPAERMTKTDSRLFMHGATIGDSWSSPQGENAAEKTKLLRELWETAEPDKKAPLSAKTQDELELMEKMRAWNLSRTPSKGASHKTPPLSDTQYGNPGIGEETNAFADVPERVKGTYALPSLEELDPELFKTGAKTAAYAEQQNAVRHTDHQAIGMYKTLKGDPFAEEYALIHGGKESPAVGPPLGEKLEGTAPHAQGEEELVKQGAAAPAPKYDAGTQAIIDAEKFTNELRRTKDEKPPKRPVVDTPEFKAWFGDSKVVDAKGEPMMVFHSTRAKKDFDTFKTSPKQEEGGWGRTKPGDPFDAIGAWFATDKKLLNEVYNFYEMRRKGPPRTVPVYLSIKKPLRMAHREELEKKMHSLIQLHLPKVWAQWARMWNEQGMKEPGRLTKAKAARKACEMEGYDGVQIDNDYHGPAWVAFYPNQIKSAIGNAGAFDPGSTSITAAETDLFHIVAGGAVPRAALAKAQEMLDSLHGNTALCGDSEVVDGWWVETHTLGCRNAADEPEDQWEASHDRLLEEYRSDGVSHVIMDDSGIFATVTPQRHVEKEAAKHGIFTGEQVVDYVLAQHKDWGRDTAYQVVGLDAGGDYELKDISLGKLVAGDDYDPATAKRYAEMDTPLPPIVMDGDGRIRDGNHRVAAGKIRGDKKIKAYVPIDTYEGPTTVTPEEYARLLKKGAPDYEGMFKSVLALTPEAPGKYGPMVKSEVAWARKDLKKQDRITWWLRWFRLSMLDDMAKNVRDSQPLQPGEGWSPSSGTQQPEQPQPEQPQPEQPNKVQQTYDNEVRAMAKRTPGAWSVPPLRFYAQSHERMQHFMSLPVPKIQNTVWDKQMPRELDAAFEGYEKEWQEQTKGLLVPNLEPVWKSDEAIQLQQLKDKLKREEKTNEDPDRIYRMKKEIQRLEDEMEEGAEEPEVDTIILQFADGWAWWKLSRAYCSEEARAMGHCGNVVGQDKPDERILSLRKPVTVDKEQMWEPHATFILEPSGLLGEMKGKANAKPVAAYHKYIVPLLELPMIKGIRGGGYAPKQNFSLADLPKEEQERLVAAKPGLLNAEMYLTRYGITEDLIKRVSGSLEWDLKWDAARKGYDMGTYPSLDNFIEERGDDTAQYIGRVMDGDEFLEVDGSWEDAAQNLDNAHDKMVADYLRANYPEAIAEWENQHEETEWSQRDIEILLEEDFNEELDEVKELLRQALDTGRRWGAEQAMFKAIMDGIDNMSDAEDNTMGVAVAYESRRNPQTGKVSPVWDAPLTEYIPMDKAVKLADSGSTWEDFQNNEVYGYDNGTPPLTVDQPHYGWDGFDKDGFNQEIEENFGPKKAAPQPAETANA